MLLSNGYVQVEGGLALIAAVVSSSCGVGLLFRYDPCGSSTLVLMCMATFSDYDVWGGHLSTFSRCVHSSCGSGSPL